jgi:hypothetical protein
MHFPQLSLGEPPSRNLLPPLLRLPLTRCGPTRAALAGVLKTRLAAQHKLADLALSIPAEISHSLTADRRRSPPRRALPASGRATERTD